MQQTLYEKIANDLSKLISAGNYGVDERLPSLREISVSFSVSIATAIQAYHLLEQEGLIEARPKSGFFVCPWAQQQPESPKSSQPSLIAKEVNVAHLAMSLINEARSPDLVKLGAAVPGDDLLPLGQLSRAVSGAARKNYKLAGVYEDAQGNIGLRRQIVKLMREAGHKCSASEIVITNGCLESLSICLRVIAKSGDTIAIESPAYFGILQVIENMGMKALEISTHPEQGICVDSLRRAINRRKIKACILVPSFSNPTGSTMSDVNKKELVKLLADSKISLIEDDIYGVLSYAPRRPKAIKAYDCNNTILYCSSFSKTIAPGLRIGWVVPGRYLEKVIYQKFLDNISTSIYPQLAVYELLVRSHFRRTLRKTAGIYRRRMEQLKRWVSEYFPPGTKMSNPQGGFLLWVECPKNINGFELYKRALAKGIAITPGILFTAQKQFENYIRLSCGAVEGEAAKKSIIRLGSIIDSIR